MGYIKYENEHTISMACVIFFEMKQATTEKFICPPEILGEVLYIPFPVQITLDSQLDDWSGIPMISVNRGTMISKNPEEDGFFQVAAASDGEKLYVVMTIKDKNIVTGQHGANWWNEDSAEFYINLGKNLLAEQYTNDAAQFNIKPVDMGRPDVPALNITGTNADKFKVEGVVFKTNDGWGFEAAVTIGDRITPKHGLEIGFQAQLNGATSKDRDLKLIWSLADTKDNSWQNPSLFGRGIFYRVGRTDIPQTSVLKLEQPEAGAPTSAKLSYNQFGYPAKAPKFASLVKAADGPLKWVLSDVATGVLMAKGTTGPAIKDPLSGDRLHRADFSNFTTPGTYTISIDEIGSESFRISNDLYTSLAWDALEFFYLMRSGIELTEEFAGKTWARPAGHLSDADIRAFAGTDAQGKKWEGFPFKIDGSGGWYDAGDFGKYVVNGGISVWTLQNAYERAPQAFSDDDQAIPEHKNGVPDILDEARWELEFMLRMQIPQGYPLGGMVFHKLHDRKWSGVPAELPERMDNNNEMKDNASWGRYVYEPSTAATLNLAASAAQASRLWLTYDQDFAERCLNAAELAWKAALANPMIIAGNVPGEGGGNYDDSHLQDDFYWAACELYATTSKVEYENYLRSSMYFKTFPGLKDNAAASMNWADTAALGSITLTIAKTGLPAVERDYIQNLIIQTASCYEAIQIADGYGTPLGANGFVWGSNSVAMNNAIIMALAYDFSGDIKHLSSVSRAMDYILGHNGLRKSFVSGYGKYSLTHPHHRVWANDPEAGYPPPPPGAICGGPNAQIQDPVAEAHGLAKLPIPYRYVDHIGSYATNEVAINWNAPLVWVTSFLNQAYKK